MTFLAFKSLVITVLGVVLKTVSPEIKQLLKQYINELYAKAKVTNNPLDDFFVEFLADILSIDLEGKEK